MQSRSRIILEEQEPESYRDEALTALAPNLIFKKFHKQFQTLLIFRTVSIIKNKTGKKG
jgi:hypothetical protein